MVRLAAFLIAGSAMLAACGGEGSRDESDPAAARTASPSRQPDSARSSPEPTPAAEASPSPSPEPEPEPEPSPSPSPSPSPVAAATPTPEPTLFNLPEVRAEDVAENRAALTTIPARFLGRWDAPDGPCRPRSEMFLTIRPDAIRFYESQGEVTKVRRGRQGIVVTLAMEGEGERRTGRYALSLVEDGELLAMRELSAPGSRAIRKRCRANR